ncbi:MAG: hypothetical protein ABSD27_03360 [Bryobacteraceae bacterium]
MATLAAFFRRTEAQVMAEAAPARERGNVDVDAWRLRPLPCEDVYLYSKKIDNSRVVREADPVAGRKAWKNAAKGACAAGLLIMLIMPKAFGMVAGYRIHLLAREHERLVTERTELQLAEARLLSPERLERLAWEYGLVSPDTKHVVFINPTPEDTLALQVTK